MNVARLVISGHNLKKELVSQCRTILNLTYDENFGGVIIGAAEKFYMRIDSDLLTVIIFDISNDDICHLRVLTGGGSQGLVGLDWGAEDKQKRSMLAGLSELCVANGWKLQEEQVQS